MKKIFFYIFATCLMISFAEVNAQQSKQNKSFNREAFESKKNAFITAEMKLTPEEAAAFIPLCNELQQKKFEVSQKCRDKKRDICKKEEPSSADYNQAINECLNSQIKEAEIEREYYAKFREVLTPEKLFKYKDAEMKFARMFIKERQKK